MTPRQSIFASLVADGMHRAYRAAEAIEQKYDITIEITLADPKGQVEATDIGNPPNVRFLYQGKLHEVTETLPVMSTFGKMTEVLNRMVINADGERDERPDPPEEALAADQEEGERGA
jgi:hypothetical protein